MFPFPCPHCGKTLKAKPAWAGRETPCPKCGGVVTVPAADPADDAAAAAAMSDTALPGDLTAFEFPAPGSTGPAANGPGARPLTRSRRRKKKSNALPLLVGGGVLTAAACGLVGWALFGGGAGGLGGEPAAFDPVLPQTVTEGRTLTVPLRLAAPGAGGAAGGPTAGGTYTVALADGPAGAAVSPDGKAFTWTPAEADGPGSFEVTVELRDAAGVAVASLAFPVAVEEDEAPPWVAPLAPVTVGPGETVTVRVSAEDPDVPPRPLVYTLEGDVPAGVSVDDAGTLTLAPPADAPQGDAAFAVRVSERAADGSPGQSTVTDVRVSIIPAGAPALADAPLDGPADPAPADVTTAGTTAADAAPAEPGPDAPGAPGEKMSAAELIPAEGDAPSGFDFSGKLADASGGGVAAAEADYEQKFAAPLLALHREKSGRTTALLTARNYPAVRALFAAEFARSRERDLETGFGEKHDELVAWLADRPEVRETLYNAFAPADDPAAGLAVFRRLYDAFGDDLERYAALATATAVVWDRPDAGVYDYTRHQTRAKAGAPSEDAKVDAVGNVKFFIDRQEAMQGRAEKLPWELQTLLVDHFTPLEERDWALNRYAGVRGVFGQCYSEVPYDMKMLETESEVTLLDGFPYTFPQILEKGGVCAHQADYAARVGKSLGVPAMYVRGEGKFGGAGGHAWVMWLDVTRLGDAGLSFEWRSHGRYRDDNYYVGFLPDPQTGEDTTDRDLARRLHAVAADRAGARHARLAMRAFRLICDRGGDGEPDGERGGERDGESAEGRGGPLSLDGKLDYLDGVVALDPFNGDAWRARAALVAEHAGDLDKKQARRVKLYPKALLKTFAQFPDFTAEAFAGLTAYEADASRRADLRKELLDLYAAAGRPDLSFEALPEYIDMLVAEGKPGDAVDTVAAAILKYAEEGRYVPAALDRLEALAADRPADVAKFYAQFVPLIPPTRGDTPSEYAVEMHKRGIAAARAADLPDLAAQLEARVLAIGEGKLKTEPRRGG